MNGRGIDGEDRPDGPDRRGAPRLWLALLRRMLPARDREHLEGEILRL